MNSFLTLDARRLPFSDKSVDLVLGSPPYCAQRTYGIGFKLKCKAWIDWMLEITAEAVRVSRGLVVWVCAGPMVKGNYWPAPEGLLYRWWESGGQCWRPAYWFRHGIAGGGQAQKLCNKIEYCLCFKGHGDLPWADNTACGHPPKWAPGGAMSHRLSDGQRVNQWGKGGGSGGNRRKNGKRQKAGRPGHVVGTNTGAKGKDADGNLLKGDYTPPVLANPGNLISVKVGGGLMGSRWAHDNEAPYPEGVPAFFVKSYCPPGGLVLDPFSGSGTTVAVAVKHGRRGIGGDVRLSQCEIGRRRCAELQTELF